MSIAALILTYNESIHIDRCLNSLVGIVDKVYVVDSFSSDDTMEKLSRYKNVVVVQNAFVNYATQFNFGLNYFAIEEEWVVRIDADEYLDQQLRESLKAFLPQDQVNAVYFNRYISFMGKVMQWGGMSDYWMLRMWRTGQGRCENTWMDEHVIVENEFAQKLSGRLVDDNLNHLSWWSIKHVNYSTREAIDVFLRREVLERDALQGGLHSGAGIRRMLKDMYNRLPVFTRPFVYFLYRFVVRGGFMDGSRGVIWCVLQGFWYRFLVDAKVYEIRSYAKQNRLDTFEAIKRLYGYDVRPT